MPVLVHGHSLFAQIVGAVIWLLLMRLSAMDTETLERLLAHAVVDALHMAGLSRKEAAALMRVDYQQFGRQLRAERGEHLSLTKLMRLCGTSFWLYFGPALMLLVARERYSEIADMLSFIGRRRYNINAMAEQPIEPREAETQRRA